MRTDLNTRVEVQTPAPAGHPVGPRLWVLDEL